MEVTDTLESADFLVRSRLEVMRLLNRIMEVGAAISIHFLHSAQVAVSAVIDVDEPGDRLLLECPPDWHGSLRGNIGAFGGDDRGGSIMLTCVLDAVKIQFQARAVEMAAIDGTSVLRLKIPDFMWHFQRRRDSRHSVAGLKIVLSLGFLGSDAEVADISKGGIGLLNCDSELKLEAGEALSDCTIALPGVGQIAVDLTVQHQVPVQLLDGRQVMRVGCQFTGLDDSTQQLIAHYLAALAEA